MHSEAKQTETEFGTEKGVLQGDVAHAPQNPEVHEEFQQSIFKSQVREGWIKWYVISLCTVLWLMAR